jgi:hypothetical protein
MRNLTNLLLTVGLALTVSTSAGAVVSIGLVQVGGTYDGILANPGDTLILDIAYAFQAGDTISLIDPAIAFDGAVSSFNAAGSTETGVACWGAWCIGPQEIWIDISLVPGNPNLADGWEKAITGASGASCPGPSDACYSMGTAAFVLSGQSGELRIGGVGLPGGTVIADGTFVDITGISNLGTFTIIPEPTTASLLGLGLFGLTAARRRRKNSHHQRG